MVEIYEVGGCVRDGILGLHTKDIDFAVEIESFEAMREYLLAQGFKEHISFPETLTMRCGIPQDHPASKRAKDADFVVCRADGFYSDGRRPDEVMIGDIWDDLARRDFTMNAVAIRVRDGEVLDPHNGIADIKAQLIRAVGNAHDRFYEDALRMIRAIRFKITKPGFVIENETYNALWDPELIERLRDNVSDERKCTEITRLMAYDTVDTIRTLAQFSHSFVEAIFGGALWLKGTLEKP